MALLDLLMSHRVNVWRGTVTPDAAGLPSSPVWAQVGTNVAAHKEGSPSARQPDVIGRVEGDNIFTLDLWHFPPDADVQADDWLENVTPGTEDLGSYWVIRGQRTEYDALGLFVPLARKRFEAFQHSRAPFSP